MMRLRQGCNGCLVPVSVLRWSSVSPVLTELALNGDPWQSIRA